MPPLGVQWLASTLYGMHERRASSSSTTPVAAHLCVGRFQCRIEGSFSMLWANAYRTLAGWVVKSCNVYAAQHIT